MLVTFAAALLIRFGVRRILIGTLASDAANGDGSASFVDALDHLLALQEGGLRLEAPAIELDAAMLIEASRIPAPLLAWSHSCHVANHACGRCRGCNKRATIMQVYRKY
jgi:7-cyano-7-deazaguanine synthase